VVLLLVLVVVTVVVLVMLVKMFFTFRSVDDINGFGVSGGYVYFSVWIGLLCGFILLHEWPEYCLTASLLFMA
jgi:hypothetical protein